jgi:hypothetical protein
MKTSGRSVSTNPYQGGNLNLLPSTAANGVAQRPGISPAVRVEVLYNTIIKSGWQRFLTILIFISFHFFCFQEMLFTLGALSSLDFTFLHVLAHIPFQEGATTP